MPSPSPQGAPERRRAEMRGPVVVVLALAGAVVFAAGLQQAASLVGPTLLALLIVVTVAPLGSWLRRRGAPVWLATLALTVVAYGILVVLAFSLVLSVERLVILLPQYQGRFLTLLSQVQDLAGRLGVTTDQLQRAATSIDPNSIIGTAQSVVGGLAGFLSGLALLAVLMFFMIVETGSFGRRLEASGRSLPQIVTAFRTFATTVRRYMVVSTIFGLLVAVLDALALWILGVPLPWLWGLFAFITNFVPNIGFVLGLVPPTLLALLGGGWVQALIVVAVYCAVNLVIQSFVQPKIVGDAVGLSPTVSFVSLVFWTLIIGPLGAVLAVPLTIFVKALLVDTDPDRAWLQPLLSGSGERRADR